MTRVTRSICDLCGYEGDGNQQYDHTDITDWDISRLWLQDNKTDDLSVIEHLCHYCMDGFEKVVVAYGKERRR